VNLDHIHQICLLCTSFSRTILPVRLCIYWYLIITLFKPWILPQHYFIFNCSFISTVYICNYIVVLTTLNMSTCVAETFMWLLCNNITFVHPSAFVSLFKQLYTLFLAFINAVWTGIGPLQGLYLHSAIHYVDIPTAMLAVLFQPSMSESKRYKAAGTCDLPTWLPIEINS
jgi:hypothetical protein